ncbi:tetraspanin [Plakobranchus ocellatus]|uniref:Tetraspanin n=1 Tax=Plakobranchus ocellatus TaxID=259542 RepID=A0AAV3ZMJ0_9GAST|nr:tetraspanin [Plakobranchus ocellatus]
MPRSRARSPSRPFPSTNGRHLDRHQVGTGGQNVHSQAEDVDSRLGAWSRNDRQVRPRSSSSRLSRRVVAAGGVLPVTPEVMEELEQCLIRDPSYSPWTDRGRSGQGDRDGPRVPMLAAGSVREANHHQNNPQSCSITSPSSEGSIRTQAGDHTWELGKQWTSESDIADLPQSNKAKDSSPLKRQRSNRSARSTTSSARRRQNEDGCVTCLRGMLHCYNVFILIVGCAALGVGIWLLVTDFGARKVTPIVGNQLYEVTTYLLMAGGGAVALLAFCGCCGTIREDKCVLSFYGTTLAIVLIVLGASCGLAIFFRTELESNIQFRMKETLTKHYGVQTRTNSENRRVTEAWDAMQRQLKCCGVVGNVTGSDSWPMYKSIGWTAEKKNHRRIVPDSCCAPGDIKICTGESKFNGPPLYFRGHSEEFRKVNPYLYTDGCYDSLIKYLETYSAVVAGVSFIMPLFLIFGIVISFCLCARVAGYSTDDEVDL